MTSRTTTSLNRFFFLFLLGLLCMIPAARGQELPEDEESLEGYREIAAFELKQMMDSNTKLLIVNVLSEIEFAFQHITGSINIPITKMQTTTALPADKSMPLIFHCLSDR
ncbi:MAG: rhodanese-like domain-containing protein [Thermodesulfobacteriota bacterium]